MIVYVPNPVVPFRVSGGRVRNGEQSAIWKENKKRNNEKMRIFGVVFTAGPLSRIEEGSEVPVKKTEREERDEKKDCRGIPR